MNDALQTLIEVVAWLAPVLSLPLYLSAGIGMGLSPGVSYMTFGGFAMLAIAPFISLLALLIILCFGKVTIRGVVAMVIPGILSLAELIFAFLAWNAG